MEKDVKAMTSTAKPNKAIHFNKYLILTMIHMYVLYNADTIYHKQFVVPPNKEIIAKKTRSDIRGVDGSRSHHLQPYSSGQHTPIHFALPVDLQYY